MDPSGAIVRGPVETNQVQSPANQNLRVQSLSGELELTGGRGVRIEDGVGFGGVEVTAHSNLMVSSLTGQVRVWGGERRVVVVGGGGGVVEEGGEGGGRGGWGGRRG